MNRNSVILINEGNILSGILEKERDLIENGAIWHKVFVRNAVQYKRDFVFRVFMDAVYPYDFIPVKYSIEGENISFLIKNCSKAIHEICNRNLTIPNPKSVSLPFKVAILLRFSSTVQIDVQSSIMKVLQKRYNGKKRSLNLTAFHKDPELVEYCPLSQPKLLYFVLHLSKGYEYRTVKLCNNDIEFTNSFEALSTMRSLLSVDLRKNKIKSFDELQVLHHWPIIELFLEDNPVCDECAESTYIKEVRQYCPKIQKLDGFTIPPQTSLLCSFRRNYLCNGNGFDLVEQFVEHYFSIYDSTARGSLESMYTKHTCFTVTATYLTGCPSFSHAKLGPYINVSHNIKQFADMTKAVKSVHIGARAIATILTQLPNTEHDPHTFTVDLLYYSEKHAVICVTGVYREPADSLLEIDRLVGFSRTFVLMSAGNNVGFTDEYLIVNEMFSVTNATASQEARAFRSGPSDVFRDSRFLHRQYVEVAPARTQSDETQFVDALMKIAGLNSKWANKCLEETNFDLNKALNLFVELYKIDKIPDAAFLSQDEITKLTTSATTKVIPVTSLSPTWPASPVKFSTSMPSQFYMPSYVVDERANPYSNDPFDTSRPYLGIERRNTSKKWNKDIEKERERALEREREWERDRRIKSPSTLSQSKSPGNPLTSVSNPTGRNSNEQKIDQFGRTLRRSRSRSSDSVELIESTDLNVRIQSKQNDVAQIRDNVGSVQMSMSLSKSVPAHASEKQQAIVQNTTQQQNDSAAPMKDPEISMSDLTKYENELNNIEGYPSMQQKAIHDIMDKLFTQYPRDVKVWLLGIGTHYKRQIPQRAREMKNRAIRAFASTPQLGFQIKLAAAQMEMEYVTGPKFSTVDKKVGEQSFLQILHQTPNNFNIARMFATCLLKRYANDDEMAWVIFKDCVEKIKNMKLPGGSQDFFDNCKLSAIQGRPIELAPSIPRPPPQNVTAKNYIKKSVNPNLRNVRHLSDGLN